MKRIVFSIALLLIVNSTAVAAPMLTEFPLGMTQKDAITKGLIVKDQQGGLVITKFGGKDWPTALVFENDKLVYLILKGEGDEFIDAADYGLWQMGWIIIYAATEKNLVFDAVKLASSGMDDAAIDDEYVKFQSIMQSQKFTNAAFMYVSERFWKAYKQAGDENPVEKYPDATMCNTTINDDNVTLVLTTFGYMDKKNKQDASSSGKSTNDNKGKQAPKQENKNATQTPPKAPAKKK